MDREAKDRPVRGRGEQGNTQDTVRTSGFRAGEKASGGQVPLI